MSNTKFFICRHCGNLVKIVKESGVPMMCCGQKMEEHVPNTTDAAGEKHVPVATVADGTVTVQVGSVEHPMADVHYIEWIALETTKGAQRKTLHPGEKPCVEFALTDDDAVVAVYAYCNLHGLWKAE